MKTEAVLTIEKKKSNGMARTDARRQYEEEYDEKLEHGRKFLDSVGLTEQAFAEAAKKGETPAQFIHRKALENAEKNKAIEVKPPKPDWMLDAVIDEWLESSDRLAEKDTEIKSLREKIARLEARLAELEKAPAA